MIDLTKQKWNIEPAEDKIIKQLDLKGYDIVLKNNINQKVFLLFLKIAQVQN